MLSQKRKWRSGNLKDKSVFKGNRKYYIILASIFVGVIVLYYSQPKPVNWNRTYAKNDKIAFGCYAIFNLLENTYGQTVEVNAQGIYHLNENTETGGQTLLVIDNEIDFTPLEVRSLFSYVEKGNTVLLCANQFGQALRDTFKLDAEWNLNELSFSFDSLLMKPAFEIAYVAPGNNFQKAYIYPKVASESYFSRLDTALFKVSAVNKKGHPVLLEAPVGPGKIYISTLPDVFGNLFIVDHPNRYYAYTLLSKVKSGAIVWDEYYKAYNRPRESLFAFLFSSNALYMAYLVTMVALLLFMVFGIKRKQRSIPVIKPLENTTLGFVDVVGHVYFNSHNHQHIALEAIRYFYFDILRKFNLNPAQADETFYINLHRLSGVDLEKIKILFRYCENLKNAPSLTERDLLELNDRITNFKQQSIR